MDSSVTPRNGRKNARTSSTDWSGSSRAGKCPPRSRWGGPWPIPTA